MPEDGDEPCLPYERARVRCGQGEVHNGVGGRNNGRVGLGGGGEAGDQGGGIMATAVLCLLASRSRGRGGAAMTN